MIRSIAYTFQKEFEIKGFYTPQVEQQMDGYALDNHDLIENYEMLTEKGKYKQFHTSSICSFTHQ